jgi:integrase
VAGWLRLDPGETKNDEGRQFPLIPELREVLDGQRARVEAIQKKTDRIVPWIFARDDGAPVGDFKKAWATACIKAGFFRVVPVGEVREGEPAKTKKAPTRIFHDFRRTAVRNLERSGVPRSAAMKLTGHQTESVYRRYAIVDEAMLVDAGAQLAKLHDSKVQAVSGKVRAIKG